MVTMGLRMVFTVLRMTRKVAERVMIDIKMITIIITMVILFVRISIRNVLRMVWIVVKMDFRMDRRYSGWLGKLE